MAQLRSLKRVNPKYNGDAYPCPYCAGWHIGRKQKSDHKNKYPARRDGFSTHKPHNVIEIE